MHGNTTLSAHGETIPAELLGNLRATDAGGSAELFQQRLNDDGYLYLTGAVGRDAVMAARNEVFSRLREVGEIGEPAVDGLSTGTSKRGELVDDLGAFWKSVCEGKALRNVTHTGSIASIMEGILDAKVKPYDFLWLRTMHPGRASAYHFDHVYMNRGTQNLFTIWTPLGDVKHDEGPIALLEGSHRWEDLISQYRGFDVDKNPERQGHVTLDPVSLARERSTRLLTAEFRAGDVLIFPMFMLHGSLDNRSAAKRVRLSADTRYQRANEPFDPRWVGDNPIGHGKGYASMGGAQPATSDPLFR